MSQLTASFNTPASLQNDRHVSVADNANSPKSFLEPTSLPSTIEAQSPGSAVATPKQEKAKPMISHLQDMDDMKSAILIEEWIGIGDENKPKICRERVSNA